MKRIFLIILAAMLLPACADADAPVQSDTDTETAVETAPPDLFDGLPDDGYDGREFHFLIRTDQSPNINRTEYDGDILNDSIYERNLTVEARFDAVITPILMDGHWGVHDAFLNTLRSSVAADDGAFDLVDGYAAVIGGCYADGLFLNLNEVRYLKLDSPWWSSLALEELTVNNRIYSIPGDIALNLWDNIHVMYFNKNMLADLSLDSPYELVDTGKWTYENYLVMNSGVANDLNGDGKMTAADTYGSVFYDDLSFDNFHNAFNITYTKKDGDGSISLDIYKEKTVETFEKMFALAYSNDDVLYAKGDENAAVGAFTEGRALLFASTLGRAVTMRDMDADFGILPYPKYDEEQKRYLSTSRDGRSMFCVPIDAPDSDFAGAITEALCRAGSDTVVPAYYEVVLKGKTTRDAESADMLDLIRAGLIIDFVAEHALQTERAGFIIRDCVYYDRDFASFYAANEQKYLDSFAAFISAYYD